MIKDIGDFWGTVNRNSKRCVTQAIMCDMIMNSNVVSRLRHFSFLLLLPLTVKSNESQKGTDGFSDLQKSF